MCKNQPAHIPEAAESRNIVEKTALENNVSCYLELVFHNRSNQSNVLDFNNVDFVDFVKNVKSLSNKFILPGSGRKPINCVDFLPVGFCPKCGHVKIAGGNCKSPQCPDCSTMWRYERVESAFKRLFSYKISKKTRMVHVTVSVPPGEAEQLKTEADINDLRRFVYRYAQSKGLDGGLLIFHPWRLVKEKKQELRDIAQGLDGWMPGDFHLWKTLIKLDNWRDFVYFSPHFHIIGACSWLEPGGYDGFVFKRIGDLMQPEDIVKCCMYLLSHVGISVECNVKNVNWFGALANCNWSLLKAPEKVQEYTIFKMKEVLHSFALKEQVNYNRCSECDVEYLYMEDAPRFFGKFSSDVNKILKFCYKWYTGSIPPPDKETVKGILSGVLERDIK